MLSSCTHGTSGRQRVNEIDKNNEKQWISNNDNWHNNNFIEYNNNINTNSNDNENDVQNCSLAISANKLTKQHIIGQNVWSPV